jgi:multidrug efflux pump subunit AcrB
MAARILKPGKHEKRKFFAKFEEGFAWFTAGYVSWVKWLIGHRKAAFAIFS